MSTSSATPHSRIQSSKQSQLSRRSPGSGGLRRVTAIVAAVTMLGTSVVAAGSVAPAFAAYPPSWNEAQFWLDKNGYGPNEAVTITVGSLHGGCDPFSGIVRISDVYVVPTGTVSTAGTLSDAGGGYPSTYVSALAGGGIIDEIVAITQPTGSLGSGTYDLVEDTCQDGVFNPATDYVLENAFTVTIPSDIPMMPINPQLAAIKAGAGQQFALWEKAPTYIRALGFLTVLLTAATSIEDLVYDQVFNIAGWAITCNSIGDCNFNPFGGMGELYGHFNNMALVAMGKANYYRGLRDDPPNPDFASPVVLPADEALTNASQSAYARAQADYYYAIQDAARLSKALLDAMEMYQGAQLADDAPAALLHAQEVQIFSAQLRAALAREDAAGDALVAAQTATGLNPSTVATQARTWATRLTSTGFTVAEKAALANLGVDTPAELAEMRQFILDIPTDLDYTNLSAFVSQQKTSNNAMRNALNNFTPVFAGLATTIETLIATDGDTPYPTVSVTAPATSTVGTAVLLTATATAGTTLEWDTDGDGAFDDATGSSMMFTPTRPGPQRVGVRATDALGHAAIAYVGLDPSIAGHAPTVTATPVGEASILLEVSETATLTAVFADADADPLTITWRDDGAVVTPSGDSLTVAATLAKPARFVTAQASDPAGNLATVRWRVFSIDADDDADGWSNNVDCAIDNPNINPGKTEVYGNGIDDDCDPATPDDPPRVVSFTTNPPVVIVGEPTTFTATASSPNGMRGGNWWDLDGNGNWDTTSATPSKTYTEVGPVPVTVWVQDSLGQFSVTQTVQVTDRPVAAIGVLPGTSVPVGDIVTLVDLSTDSDGGVVLREWDLDYNGASFRPETTVANPQVSVGRPVTVALRVTDAYGAVSAITTVRLANTGSPVAAFGSTPVSGEVNLALPASGASVVSYSSRYDTSRGPEQAIAYKAATNNGVYWRSAIGHTSGEWMIVDLGATYELSAIALRTANSATGRIRDIRLSIGSDPNDPSSFRPWVDDEFPNIPQAVTWRAVGTGPVGRYVRLDVDSVWSGSEFYLASFEVYSGQVGVADVQFTDRSIDPETGGGITGWYWSFGDGTTSTEQNPRHNYPGPGTYTVTLTVQDAAGDQDTVTGTYEVRVPLNVTFTMSPEIAVIGEAVEFNDTTAPPSTGGMQSRAWDLDGDGTTDSTSNRVTHSYSTAGVYSVTLTDVWNSGVVGYASRNLRVTDRPIAEFTSSDWEVLAGQDVTLTDQSTDDDGGIVAWEWDFDYDGVEFTPNSGAQNPTFTVGRPTTVALRVTDAYGIVSAITTHRITVPGPPVPAFRSEATTGLVNMALNVHGASLVSASSAFNNNYLASWAIEWRGASPTGGWCTAAGQPTDQWAVYDLGAVYPLTAVALRGGSNATGAYAKNVRVLVGTDLADLAGFVPMVVDQLPQSAARIQWTTTGAPLVGRYLRVELLDNWGGAQSCLTSIEALTGAVGGPTVQFTDLSRDPDIGGSITNWLWDFGDGATSTSQNPEHTYAAPGIYPVTLTVTDAEELTRSVTQNYEVKALLSGLTITSDSTPLDEATHRYFRGSTTATDRGVATWDWSWGDGTATAAYQTPGHRWADNGVYTVTLTATDTYGLTISTTVEVAVVNVAPSVGVLGQNYYNAGDVENMLWAGVKGTDDRYWNNYPWMNVLYRFGFSFSDPSSVDSDTLVCKVDWGDGAVEEATGIDCSYRLLNRTDHAYATPGTYTITWTVTDKDGGVGTVSTPAVVRAPAYLQVYPVAGTLADGAVTLRVKLWDAQHNWTLVSGASVQVTLGSNSETVITDANGEAEVRLPYQAGDTASAVFAGNATVAAASGSNDFSRIGQPAGDVMFLVDESGSMEASQAAVRTNLGFISSQLEASGIDYHVGVAGLAGKAGWMGPTPTAIEMPVTTHFGDFGLGVGLLDTAHVGELAIDSVYDSFEPRFGYRPEAAQCVVVVLDETTAAVNTHTVTEAAARLAERDAVLFAIMQYTDTGAATATANQARAELTALAAGSGGQTFDLPAFTADPETVLGAITTACVRRVQERPDVAVSASDGVDSAASGSAGTYTVTVTNNGLQAATGVTVELTVAGPQTVGTISGGGTALTGAGGTVVTWPVIAQLDPGEKVSFIVARTVDADAALDAQLSATATVADDGTNGLDLVTANNQASDVTVVSAPATVVNVAISDASKTYGDADPTAYALTGLPASWVEGVDYTVTFSRAQGEDVGGYEVTAQVSGLPAGYVIGTVTPGMLTVTAKPLAITVGSAERAHTGSVIEVNLSVAPAGLRDGDILTSPISVAVSGVGVGDYPSTLAASAVSVTRGGVLVTGNYDITITQGRLTIISAIVDLAVTNSTKVYGEADPSFALSGLPVGWVEGTDYIVTFDRTAGENVDDYDVDATVTILRSGYVLGTVTPGTLSITPREATVSVGQTAITYTGLQETIGLPVSAVGLRSGDVVAMSTVDVVGTAVGTYPSMLNVADVQVMRDGVSVTGNYTMIMIQGALVIVPVGTPLPTPIDATTLSVRSETKVYGEADPTNYVLEGWPDETWVAGADYTVTFLRAPGEGVGSYGIEAASVQVLRSGFALSGALSDIVGGILTITPRPITLTVGEATDLVTGALVTVDLPVSLTSGSLAAGDTLVTTVISVTGTAMGTYPSELAAVSIQGGGSEQAANYQIDIVQGQLTLEAPPAPQAIESSSLSLAATKVYGEPDPGFNLVGWPLGWVEGIDWMATYARTPGETVGPQSVGVASLTILRSGFVLSGTVDDIDRQFTITPRPITVTVGHQELTVTGSLVAVDLPVTVTDGSLA